MSQFPVLLGIESLVVFTDHDKAGIRAAHEVAARWKAANRLVVAVKPARPGSDANDVLREALDA